MGHGTKGRISASEELIIKWEKWTSEQAYLNKKPVEKN